MPTTRAEPRTATRLQALAEAAAFVGAAPPDPTALADLVTRHAAELVGDAATLWLLPTGAEQLVCAGSSHPDPAVQRLLVEIRTTADLADADVITRTVVTSGEALVVPAEEVPTRVGPADPGPPLWLDRRRPAGVAVVPMRGRGRVVGVLALTRDDERGGYSPDDLAFLQALADIAGAGVDIARLVDDSAAALGELHRQIDLLDHVSDAVIVLDGDQRVLGWNAGAERIYGYSAGEVLGGDLFALLATQWLDTDGVAVPRDTVVAEVAQTGEWRGELRERRADGAELEVLSSFSMLPDSTGAPSGIVVVNRDVTVQRHKEHQANHDGLTGLPNRMLMSDRLADALEHAARIGTTVAVIFLDLNGFKAVNDRLGHDAGDHVLRVTAARLAGAIRGSDVLARLGGDEFVVIAENVNRDGAELLGRRLLDASDHPIMIDEQPVRCVPSIGIAVSHNGQATPDDLLKAADGAMYEAKEGGLGFAFAP